MERRPIAKKYCEGKVKRTLKRESKELEIVTREAKSIELKRWLAGGWVKLSTCWSGGHAVVRNGVKMDFEKRTRC